MGNIMSDHRESDLFTYGRTWEEIESMLTRAETMRNKWEIRYQQAKEDNNRKGAVVAARNYKALEGVVKTLRWVLGDLKVGNPLN